MRIERADVVIIGGGPAGSTAATLLKQYAPNRRIVLLEQSRFPRHHIGESTLPDTNPILHKLGVLEKINAAGFVRKTGITYKWSATQPLFSDVFSEGILDALAPPGTASLPDYSWQVDRSRYDEILLNHARESGVDVRSETRVIDIVSSDNRVRGVDATAAGGPRYRIESEIVVDCSGQARVLSRWLHLEKQSHSLGDLAIYRYYRGMRWIQEFVGTIDKSRIFFSATAAGWMWFIPLSEHEVSVGLVTRRGFLKQYDPEELFERELASVPEMKAMLENAEPMPAPGAGDDSTRLLTIADWSYNHLRPSGPGYYLAGDAAAFVDPILSSGVLLAHHAGLSVANAINTGWLGSEISEKEIHEGYARFYADLYGGFLAMARWWYERRGVADIDEWMRMAAELGKSARGSLEIDRSDVGSFMTFAAGYLTDFRFVNLGFGELSLVEMVSGIEGDPKVGARLRREIADRTTYPKREFDRFEVEAYLATDVDTDRWWRFPVIKFTGPFGERSFRPPMTQAERGEETAPLTLKVLDRLLACCDGTRSVEQVVRTTRDSFDRGLASRVQQMANRMLADLVMLEVVALRERAAPQS